MSGEQNLSSLASLYEYYLKQGGKQNKKESNHKQPD